MEDLKNKRFGKLIAIKPDGKYQRETIWLCQCDCGKETRVRISKLKNGYTTSCSCIKRPPVKYGKEHHGWQGYEGISKSFLSRMQHNAKQRNYEWTLTPEFLWQLYLNQNKKCALSGRTIEMPSLMSQLRDKYNDDLASLDRIDPHKGYIEGNVQWICKRINYMKHTLAEEKFLSYVKDICNFRCIK